MLSEIRIRNFQSHKDTTLEFDPGVNVIVGSSDSGKTAVIRALRLAIQNRPSGDAFVSNWIKKGDKSSIEVTVDGDVVTRMEYPKKLYAVNDKEFEAFGLSVPDEITEALRMDTVNLQGQLDSPFLLSSSPGDVALHFNKVAKLDKIDTGLRHVQKQIAVVTSEIEYNRKRKETLTADLEQFEHLQKFEAEIEVLEELQIQLKRQRSKVSDLDVLISRLSEVQESIDGKADIIKMEVLLFKVLENIEQKRTLAVGIRKLDSLIATIRSDQKNLASYTSIVQLEEPVANLLKLHEVKSGKNQQVNLLKKALNGIASGTTMLKQKEAEFERLHAQFEDEMGDHCILCGQAIEK